MTTMRILTAMLLLVSGSAYAAALNATLIELADNPQLDRTRLERAYLAHPGGSAMDGLTLAVEEAQFELNIEKASIKLNMERAASIDTAIGVAQKAEKSGSNVLVVNLPGGWLSAVASAVKLPILNVGAREDNLREKDCSLQLFHLMPSERMHADALAQALMARRWQNVLLLQGGSPQDAARSMAVQSSLKRYGLKTVAVKPFKLSTDPRERAHSNLALLTAHLNYDAVWVVDSDGEFARNVPYNTQLPRPVVGDGGLVAVAWQMQFERFGAPQVSRRFAKSAKRAMTDHDWAAWLAGKALVAVATTTQKPDTAAVQKSLLNANLDGSKGVAMQFRSWDRQLRQPILLTDGQGVQGMLPMDGVLHPKNILDTLGADEGERLCKFKS